MELTGETVYTALRGVHASDLLWNEFPLPQWKDLDRVAQDFQTAIACILLYKLDPDHVTYELFFEHADGSTEKLICGDIAMLCELIHDHVGQAKAYQVQIVHEPDRAVLGTASHWHVELQDKTTITIGRTETAAGLGFEDKLNTYWQTRQQKTEVRA